MNVDRILETFNRHQVACLLIGGMNFLLRHQPVLTFDIDLWISDEDMLACQLALDERDRKPERVRVLREALHHSRYE